MIVTEDSNNFKLKIKNSLKIYFQQHIVYLYTKHENLYKKQ